MKSILGQSPQPNQAIGFSRWRPVAKSPFSRRGPHTLLAATLLASILLTGCSSTPAPTPTPTALIAGKFATEQEALAAAREVYLKYAALSEAYAAKPTEEIPALKAITSEEMYKFETSIAELLAQRGFALKGSLIYTNFKFTSATSAQVSFEVCGNNSGVRLIDSSGADITDDSDSTLVPMVGVVDFSSVAPIIETVDAGEAFICVGQ